MIGLADIDGGGIEERRLLLTMVSRYDVVEDGYKVLSNALISRMTVWP